MTQASLSTPAPFVGPLAANRGALAVLAPVHAGALSLVIGTGQDAIPTTISRLGGRTVGIDWSQPASSDSKANRHPCADMRICSDWRLPLPFASETFDNVFLTQWGDARTKSDGVGGLQAGMLPWLAECHRLLKGGGTLVVEAPNRLSYLNWLGKGRGREHGGRLEILPRGVMRIYRRVRGNGSRVRESCSHSEYLAGFRSAGFDAAQRFIPWPDRLYWFRLWPANIAAKTPLPFWGSRLRDRIAEKVFQFLRVLRIQQWLVPDYIYVMRKGPTRGAMRPASVLEVVGSAMGPRDTHVPELRSYHNSNSLIFMDAERVFKIPLSREGQDRLWREKKALEAVGSHPIAPLAIKPLAYSEDGGLSFAVYPRADEALEGKGRVRHAHFFLRQILDSSETMPVTETHGWQRMLTSASEGMLNEIGAERLLKRIERSVVGGRAPAGLIHGDFGLHNILQDPARNPVVIDWDRSEENSPVFFDVLSASHFFALRYLLPGAWERDSYLAAWRLLFEEDERLPFGVELSRSKGDLDMATMTAITVLNSISWESERGSHAYGALIALCEEHLRRTDGP